MKFIRLYFFIFINIFLCSETSYSQIDTTIYKNRDFDKKIHNSLIYQNDNQLSYPIINLNSEDKLTLLFDDFKIKCSVGKKGFSIKKKRRRLYFTKGYF